MEISAATITELMNSGTPWNSILHNFELSNVTATKFTDYYYTDRYLMVSKPTQITDVIYK